MSRCFPFPPPGYERKARSDDADILKKEKRREKKDKKEKKEKKKSEGKERREKDRSEGKHKDKKDRKEKHRDKKKDKEKDGYNDKDKSSTTVEKRIAGQSEIHNGEKLNQSEREWDKDKHTVSNEKKQVQNGEKPKPGQNILFAERAADLKFVQEFNRRIKDSGEGTGSQLVEKQPATEQKNAEPIDRLVVSDTGFLLERKEKVKEKRVDNKKIDGRSNTHDARLVQNSGGSQLVERQSVTEQKNDERMDRTVVKDTGYLLERKEKNKEKRVDGKKIDGQSNTNGAGLVQNSGGMFQNRVQAMPHPLEKNIERRREEKDKSRETEKKSHRKDKDREKEKKKEGKVKEKSEHKNKNQDNFKDLNKNNPLDTQNILTSVVAKHGDRNTTTEEGVKKRKQNEANGFLHETDLRPNKVPRPSPYPSAENGKKSEPCETPILFTSGRPIPPNNFKVDNKERKANGLIEAPPLSISKRSPSAVTRTDQIAQASVKAAHPDSKYLSQVLSVPKMEEWSEFDEQEWLFSSKNCLSEKPVVGSAGVAETPYVWAEALQIESADVCALPYVIPY